MNSLVPLGTRGYPRFRFLVLLLRSSWLFCQVCRALPTRNHWQKIANLEPLHTPTMEFVDFVLSGSELAKKCQHETIGNFLPTRSHKLWQKGTKLGRNSVEFVLNLADLPRTWQKKQEFGRKSHKLGRAQKIPPPHCPLSQLGQFDGLAPSFQA
jgi:hypothetical protein